MLVLSSEDYSAMNVRVCRTKKRTKAGLPIQRRDKLHASAAYAFSLVERDGRMHAPLPRGPFISASIDVDERDFFFYSKRATF